jgi:FAD/FMN-containing dehydrogenase
LSLLLKGKVYFPDSPAYMASLGSYFSLQETAVHPLCIVSPQTAQDVSAAVSVLTTAYQPSSGCQFAIRSGGHASFAGAANIQGGVTIDLTALDSIVLDQGVPPAVSVGVGATWGDVYSHLDTVNLSVAGGRAAGVGVGGLTIGGGISYFGPRFGWTCDTVTSFEVVLANGSIINANNDENVDLLWALRGGTNNFGIITRIDLQTFEQGDLWGGEVLYPISTADEQIIAMAAFNNPATYDEFSSLITTFAYSGAEDISVIVNNMEYTKPVVDPSAFHSLSSLPPLASTQRITNVTDLVTETETDDANGFR